VSFRFLYQLFRNWASSLFGSERESVEMCILRGFLKGTRFSRFSTEWPINRGLAVEMTHRGRDAGLSATTVLNPRQSYISTDSRAEPIYELAIGNALPNYYDRQPYFDIDRSKSLQ